jgi:hypothetical protein
MDRSYLTRALAMGFNELLFVRQDAPMVATDDRRTYLWMTLDPGTSIKPKKNMVTISSSSSDSNTSTTPSPSRTIPMRKKRVPAEIRPEPSPVAENVLPATSNTGPAATGTLVRRRKRRSASNAGVLDQAIALRTALRNAAGQVGELVRTIKRQRKQDRILRSTLASLKQLQGVA